jgi:catalase-peroxidase
MNQRRSLPSLSLTAATAALGWSASIGVCFAAPQGTEAARCPVTGMTADGSASPHGAPAAATAADAAANVAAATEASRPQDPPAGKGKPNDKPWGLDDWWPNRLDLSPLSENQARGNPMGADFDYAKEFASLDLPAVKKEIEQVLKTSQPWWPADYGHYGPLMVRLAWHSAGTYRTLDGRGGSASGTIRFAPLNSWPDNGNLDKARRLLWPIKQKYGSKLSWADLIVLTGNVALESMGFQLLGFAGGREDVFEPDLTNWGPETVWLDDKRYSGNRELAEPLAAVQMGLIYVNPEGPNGKPDPLAAAKDIRDTFGRMAMNDEETVALIAGGHTIGKAHGAGDAKLVGPDPEAAALEEQGLGWRNAHGTGKGPDAITSGLEGAWTSTPIEFSNGYFDNLFKHEWELTKSPAGAQQWRPKGNARANVPDAHDPAKTHLPVMFTTDLALRFDPIYGPISKRFHENPAQFVDAFAKAWFKLTHRDMGPHTRLVGKEVPPPQPWQDVVPAVDHELITAADATELKRQVLASGASIPQLVRAAWASASSFRGTDMRGGANGARVRLAPQKDWAANSPAELAKTIALLEGLQKAWNGAQSGKKRVSLADLIVLAGNAAVEAAAKQGGQEVAVPFTPGRTDATPESTDVASFAVLEPIADGFRNHLGKATQKPTPVLLVERAYMLNLSAPEMTVLVGGLRALNANTGEAKHGVLTARPGVLTNDFFVNLLDLGVQWKKSAADAGVYEAVDAAGKVKWTGTAVDLVFGSNSQLRAIAEVYAGADASKKFVADFVAAWTKVMQLDRFDV